MLSHGPRRPVDQSGQEGQSASAVREEVVEDDNQRSPAAARVRHKLGFPQGTIAREKGQKHLRGNTQDGALTARRWTTDHGEVAAMHSPKADAASGRLNASR